MALWYHFAIMFEALFILTTIDAGTRIGRFLLQELMGRIHPKFGDAGWWPGTLLSTGLIVGGWAYFINSDSFSAIWTMFGVANQMLAVIALAIVSAYLFNVGRGKWIWVTVGPMVFVMTTTSTAAVEILLGQIDGIRTQLAKATRTAAENGMLVHGCITASLLVGMLFCTILIIAAAGARIAVAESAPPGSTVLTAGAGRG
jgi:carbon starvation protein